MSGGIPNLLVCVSRSGSPAPSASLSHSNRPAFADDTVLISTDGSVYEDENLFVAFCGYILDPRVPEAGRGPGAARAVHDRFRAEGVGYLAATNGQFSLLVYEKARKRLAIYPDKFGFLPAYWRDGDGCFVFGSRLKEIVDLPFVPERLNEAGLFDIFKIGSVIPPETLVEGVQVFLPGQYIVCDREGRRSLPYPAVSANGSTTDDYHALVTESMKQCVGGAGKIAVLLSGIDSALLAVRARRLYPNAEIQAITLDPHRDDRLRRVTARVAELAGARHGYVTAVPPEAHARLAEAIFRGESVGGASFNCAAEYRLMAEVDDDADVVLSGDGNDVAWGLIDHRGPWKTRKAYLKTYMAWRSKAPSGEIARLLGPVDPERFLARIDALWEDDRGAIENYMRLDASCLGVGIFRKTILAHRLADRRFRMPYCDMAIRAFINDLPMERKMKRTFLRRERKWFFKEACRPYLPEEMIRRKKGWLGSTVAEWFRSEQSVAAAGMLFEEGARSGRYVDAERLKSLMREHRSGAADHAFELQTALSLELWLRMMFHGEEWGDLVEGLSAASR